MISRLAAASVACLSLLLMGSTCGTLTSAEPEVLILEVGPETVACVGEMVQRCLQVRAGPEEEWKNFYDPIEGFEHEEGFLYRIEVERTRVPEPLADASSYTYRLLRVLSKEPA